MGEVFAPRADRSPFKDRLYQEQEHAQGIHTGMQFGVTQFVFPHTRNS